MGWANVFSVLKLEADHSVKYQVTPMAPRKRIKQTSILASLPQELRQSFISKKSVGECKVIETTPAHHVQDLQDLQEPDGQEQQDLPQEGLKTLTARKSKSKLAPLHSADESMKPPPAKRQKRDYLLPENSRKYDASEMVPFYRRPSQVPTHLQKCKYSFHQHNIACTVVTKRGIW